MVHAGKLLCFDLEMCCWDDGRVPRTGEIIEIGCCLLDIKTEEVEAVKQYYVRPERDEISAFCTSLTGITPEIIKEKGVPLAEAISSLTKQFGYNKVYVSWGADHHVLRKECEAKGIEYPIRAHIDLSIIHRVQKRMGKKKLGMKRTMAIHGIPMEGRHHSGVDDARNLAKLALHLL